MIKKLLMLYWEIVPKYSADSKLLPEMILVCNALRNDLTSPNEFVRGCMLRFLCKMKEAELLEPLVPSIKLALEHRHCYVRRNAALAVYSIHKNFGDQLLPDGPELMEKFIRAETDMSARRNAFLMLFNEAEHIAIDFLTEHIDDIQKYGDGFALLVLELTRKVEIISPCFLFMSSFTVITYLYQITRILFYVNNGFDTLLSCPNYVSTSTLSHILCLCSSLFNLIRLAAEIPHRNHDSSAASSSCCAAILLQSPTRYVRFSLRLYLDQCIFSANCLLVIFILLTFFMCVYFLSTFINLRLM